jgi:hypothetical protein
MSVSGAAPQLDLPDGRGRQTLQHLHRVVADVQDELL